MFTNTCDTAWDGDASQTIAITESESPYADNSARYRNVRQTMAIVERTVSDAGDATRDSDACQVPAILESVGADDGDGLSFYCRRNIDNPRFSCGIIRNFNGATIHHHISEQAKCSCRQRRRHDNQHQTRPKEA